MIIKYSYYLQIEDQIIKQWVSFVGIWGIKNV